MKPFKLILFAIISISILSCESDDGPTFTDEQRQLIMGDEGEGIRVLGLLSPIVVNKDDVHSNLRELDMDQNAELDVTIRSFQGFFGDKGLVISTVNSRTSAQVMVDAEGLVIPLNSGEAVLYEEGLWADVEEAPLAVFNPGEGTTGLWNGLNNKYVAFKMQDGNTRYLAWIELSVSDHDNYSFYNYGIKIVP